MELDSQKLSKMFNNFGIFYYQQLFSIFISIIKSKNKEYKMLYSKNIKVYPHTLN